MNKRIKELAEQAQDWADAHAPYASEEHEYFVEKFAQLIVRECVKIMYDNAIDRKVPPDINQTPTHYTIAVLEHFGVEE